MNVNFICDCKSLAYFFIAIGKEGKDRKLLHSLVMSAAQRIKKTPKQANSSQSKEEVTTPTSPKSFSSQLSSLSDLKEVSNLSFEDLGILLTHFIFQSTTTDSKVVYVPASNAEREMENSSEKLKRRLEKFNRETQEDIQKSRWPPNDFGKFIYNLLLKHSVNKSILQWMDVETQA